MIIDIETLPISQITVGSVVCSMVQIHLTHDDVVSGVAFEVTMNAKPLSTTKCYVLGSFGGLSSVEVTLELAGNTLYDVGTAGAGTRKLGEFTFDFTTYTRNRFTIKQGVAIGGITFPAVMPPYLTLIFEEAGFNITSLIRTKKEGQH